MTDGYHTQYFQPPLHPSPPAASGDAWAVNSNASYQPMGEASANVNTNTMNAKADSLEDQEKRLFLEEYRYPGQHMVSPNPRLLLGHVSSVSVLN